MKKLYVMGLVVVTFLLLCIPSGQLRAADEPINYMLFFQVNEYDSKIGDALNFFFKKSLKPQDQVTLFSPIRPYSFSQQTRKDIPAAKLADRVKNVMKKDISISAADYISTQDGMVTVVRSISESLGTSTGSGMAAGRASGNDLKNLLTQYKQLIDQHRSTRKLSTNMFLQLAGKLKPLAGSKVMIFAYQQTYRIVPDKDTMDVLRENPEVSFLASEAFFEENTSEILDAERIAAALEDANVAFHFIYITKQPRRKPGIDYKELSGDVYSALSKITKSRGGQLITTSKPEAALKQLLSNE